MGPKREKRLLLEPKIWVSGRWEGGKEGEVGNFLHTSPGSTDIFLLSRDINLIVSVINKIWCPSRS